MKASFCIPPRAAIVLSCVLIVNAAWGQPYGSAVNLRFAIMNGNQVRTVFTNGGVIAQPAQAGHRGAWRYDNDGYLGDVSPLIGAEVPYHWPNPAGHTKPDTVFHQVLECPVSRPAKTQDVDPVSGVPWVMEPEPGYFNPKVQSVAMSNDSTTWPPSPGWPDKQNDPNDPGWIGKWNGYFGKRESADLETYFVMDDNNDLRYNFPQNNAAGINFQPDSTKGAGRDGLGIVVSVRALQWAQFLAKDNIFWLYNITNTGTTNFNRVAFGMLVGTYVGVTSTEDYGEYSDDWSFYDVFNNLTYSGDFKRIQGLPMKNPLWIGPVGMVGYAFLESPGNGFDGIDNDGDADSTVIGRAAPQFSDSSFAPRVINVGDRLVIIHDDFSRTIFTVPNADSVRVWTHGMPDSIWIYPGRTSVVEGNVLTDYMGNPFLNPNAYDGIDNNFNGLIDENYYVDYHEIKVTKDVPPKTLINILRPLRHIDYLTGAGMSPFSMIDERRDDLIDNNNDWSKDPHTGAPFYDGDGNLLDDVGRDGVQYTNDYGERDGLPTSGYDNLYHDTGLPGEPHIDKTDVNESDQIGLTSFWFFTPSNQVSLGDMDYMWKSIAPGYFDVPPQIINNRPTYGSDGDFIYGSGYFPLLASKTERFSLALVYGGGQTGGTVDDDIASLLKNKQVVQSIYNANYQFPTPPAKPHLTAVPGDRRVTLYWDRRSETSVDPALKTRTFEGYKIYRSTDPDFSDVFTITDATGTPQGYRPLAQFDLQDSIKGNFVATGDLFTASNGYVFYLGSDNGLQHSYVDSVGLDNGRRYFYAVVSYSRGDNNQKVFPAENTKRITIAPTGEVTTDLNTAVVVPNAVSAGYVHSPTGVPLNHTRQFGTGSVAYRTVDEAKLLTHAYQVQFSDTQIDSVDANGNVVQYTPDSTRWTRITTNYSVKDLTIFTDKLVANDTSLVSLSRKNVIPASITLVNAQGAVVPPANYVVAPAPGFIRGKSPGSLPAGNYTISYQYYPVFQSPYMQGTPFQRENKDSDIFDGIQLLFQNTWVTSVANVTWTGTPKQYRVAVAPTSDFAGLPFSLTGIRAPASYRMQFFSTIVDTSQSDDPAYALLGYGNARPVNWRIFNTTDSTYVKFYWFNPDNTPGIQPFDDIAFLEPGPNGHYVPTWDIIFTDSSALSLGAGVTLTINTVHPFRNGDIFEFTPTLPTVSGPAAHVELNNIRVVPNPYVAASSFELPLPPAITSGRERKIDFIHLPPNCTIKIFTTRGDHVITLVHEGNAVDGSVSWNLKSKENLDIAYGVYFYVVESPYGNKTGKIAIIK